MTKTPEQLRTEYLALRESGGPVPRPPPVAGDQARPPASGRTTPKIPAAPKRHLEGDDIAAKRNHLAAELAAHLDAKLELPEEAWCGAKITTDTGAVFRLTGTGPSKDRITISPDWPRSEARHTHMPPRQEPFNGITVSARRDVESLLNDITRRFVEPLGPIHAKCRQRRDEDNARQRAMQKLTIALADICGADARADHGRRESRFYADGVRCEVTPGNDVSLELRLTPNEAESVLLALMFRRKNPRKEQFGEA